MAATAFTLTFPQKNIALLTLDVKEKGANILSTSVLEELDQHLSELEKRTDLAGLVIASGKPGTFIAGADLREFAASLDVADEEIVAMCRRGQTLFQKLSATAFVTVAAIDGICVGGGAELAGWCDRRVFSAEERTQYGFPEVKLGIFPGWGGTARMSRMVGLGNAVEMITSGENIGAKQARELGLADDVAPAEKLLEAACDIVLAEAKSKAYLADRKAWSGPIEMPETELAFLGATASAYIMQQTKGQYPAPLAALELMIEASGEPIEKALEMEAEGMAELFGSPVMSSLLNVFFLTDRNKKDKGVEGDIAPAEIKSVGVIGSGIMGSGIAAAYLKRKTPVVLMDARSEALQKGAAGVIEEVSYNKETKKTDASRALEFAPLLNSSQVDTELVRCDLLVEAIVENIDAKRELFARLEPQLSPTTILASNTSTIPITKLAAGLKNPERFCGLHFFNPVRKMKLVEVIRGEQTSDATVATVVASAKKVGKMPIVVNDGPGFLVNRLLFPYMNEALELLMEGASMKEIEKAAKAFGMPMGPMALYDMVGIDTSLYAGKVMYEAFPNRIKPSLLLNALMKAGRLGEKSGKGFFSYENKKKKAEPDPEVEPILETYRKGDKQFSQEEITNRLFLPMLLEATRLLEDQIVRDVRDIDLGLIFGIGFPPFRGGLLYWADTLGAKQIVETLAPFAPLGERFVPTPLLLEMAVEDEKFYE